MELSEGLDIIGNLIAALKQYASKLPAMVPRSAVPGGIKPTPESIETYEHAVSRFRLQSGGSVYKNFNEPLIESLEAFEAGKLLGAIQPLLAETRAPDKRNKPDKQNFSGPFSVLSHSTPESRA